MIRSSIKNVAVIVAHPDDETLWAGGTILSHPSWKCFIVCLSRMNDPDRAAKFYKALQVYKCQGIMGDLDDGPDQKPMDEKDVQRIIYGLLPAQHFDLVISHNPSGEYTRHLRHEEAGKAVIKLWHSGKISATELWAFAYQDGNKAFFPRAVGNADVFHTLTKRIWLRKYSLITDLYGFSKLSWEAETTPQAEAFWQFTDPNVAKRWINNAIIR
jgi:LmbE family N-acetylglucosaminyl deacetylase